jgi:hypothetical protein
MTSQQLLIHTMPDIGPELPAHLLAKRKRKQEEAAEAPSVTASGAKISSSPDGGEKRRKVMGPAVPPAPLDERPEKPVQSVEDAESDDDDGFGPALPTNGDKVRLFAHYLCCTQPTTTGRDQQ